MASKTQKWYNIRPLQEGIVPIGEIDSVCCLTYRENGTLWAESDALARYSAAYPTGAERIFELS